MFTAGVADARECRAIAAIHQSPAPNSPKAPVMEDLLVPATVPVDGRFPLGMVLDKCSTSNNIIVSSVVEGSWAAENGIQPGDEVVMLNGVVCQGAAEEQVQKLGRKRPLQIRIARGAFPAPADTPAPTVLELEERICSARSRAELAEQRLAALAAESNGQDGQAFAESVRAYQAREAAAESRIAEAGRRAASALQGLCATGDLDRSGPLSHDVAALHTHDAYSDEMKPDPCWG